LSRLPILAEDRTVTALLVDTQARQTYSRLPSISGRRGWSLTISSTWDISSKRKSLRASGASSKMRRNTRAPMPYGSCDSSGHVDRICVLSSAVSCDSASPLILSGPRSISGGPGGTEGSSWTSWRDRSPSSQSAAKTGADHHPTRQFDGSRF